MQASRRRVGPCFAAAPVALSLLATGCAARSRGAPPVLELPPLSARVSQRAGAPLGPVAPAGSVELLAARSEPGWMAQVALFATEFDPAALEGVESVPLGARARLISAELGGAAVEPRVLLAEGAWRVESRAPQLIQAPPFGRTRRVDSFEGALLSGATLRLEWRSTAQGERRALRVELARESPQAQGAELALVFEGELELDHDNDPATAALRTLRREALLLEELVPLGADGVARCVLPSPFSGGEARGLVLEVALEARDDEPAREAALERCRASEQGAARATRALIEPEARGAELRRLADALESGETARAALFELARRTGAELSADLALCAADAELPGLAQAARDALATRDALAAPTAELGWRVERASLSWLAAQKDTRALPYEFEGVLLRRTGELGRSAAALADAATTCTSLLEFARRLHEENWSFLDDHGAATRVRAFDWLRARGWAPPGYDPLAERGARRAALEAAGNAP